MKKEIRKKRVVLGMSAGVDSSVAAALLKKQGYEVIGVFMHFWKEPGQDELRENKCCSLESQQDARTVAHILDIPLYTANVAAEFKREVVDAYLEGTKNGRTPNPCVVCNQRIKFQVLMRKMLEMDADYVATGHYATVREKGGRKHLYTSIDDEKDQTYFLYNLTQGQLEKVLFPVGGYDKARVREMAQEFNLPVFDKDDSQGLCFTPEKYPTEFLKRNLQLTPGKIIDTAGKVLGEHQGLELYTIGQRKGINIGGTGPYYVVDRDFGANALVVTNNESDPLILRKGMKVKMTNWVAFEPKLPLKALVKIRYRHPNVACLVERAEGDDVYEVRFSEPQRAVTIGQSAVFYGEDGEIYGGGSIEEAL
ncbi:MAG TPA: tRNA 2-thiouridine(34) synthase MnmA [Candidatus Moranbacteria bacterium]|nr:tRNA 2-thiouridine(34) synthase MnmA [Candidatus Moranbacteria bacterium]